MPAAASTSAAEPAPAGSVKPLTAINDPYLRDEIAQIGRRRTQQVDATVDVEILHDHVEADIAQRIAQLGGTVTGVAPGTVVQAKVPIAVLTNLQSTPGVDFLRRPVNVNVRPATIAVPQAGPVTTEAVSVMKADAWHQAGRTGAGVKVGIIDFFNAEKWDAQARSGEVPAVAGTFCIKHGVATCAVWDTNEDGHGNAVAEIIHDLAPDAQLYLGRADTISDSYALVNWFIANGVTIVNRSLGSSYDGPGDGTGPLDELVDFAANRGITWFNSAGNEGSQRYWRGTAVDADNDGWIEFGPGDETMNISGGSSDCLSVLGARWNDWGPPATRTDYDFYIYAGDRQVYPSGAATGPDQQLGAPPIELDGIEGCESGPLNIRVRKWAEGSGSAGDILEILMYSGDLEYSQSSSSASGPIVDSKNRAVLAVGAIDPPRAGSIAYYSSQGPTNDGRRKPDLSAPSCFTSSIYSPFGSCFNGTSAASPAAAGMAAIVASAGLTSSPQGLAALMKHFVVDRGPAGPDSIYGTGEARLPDPVTTTVNAGPSAFVGISPTRVVDTRRGIGPLGRPLDVEEILDVPMAGVGPVPANATSVAMNVTIVGARAASYVQVLPTLYAPIDASSSLNLEAVGQVLPNFVVSPVGRGGQVSVYAPSGGDLLIDLLGYFVPSEASAAGRVVSTTPTRVLDTRQSAAARPDLLPTGWSNHRPTAGEIVSVEFRASTGLPASGVAAVILNVTATGAAASGFVTAFPSGTPLPDASVLNLTAGGTSANTVIVPLGADRRVNLYTYSSLHLLVDIAGYITDATAPASGAGRFVPVSPSRIFDTRQTGSPLVSTAVQSIDVGGRAGIPAAGAAAVSYNVTATATTGPDGYVQMWPSGSGAGSESSNVNWTTIGQTVASGGIVKLGASARVDARSYQGTHLLLDVNGYFTS